MSVLIFSGNTPQLLLTDVTFDSQGRVQKGFVLNGAWDLVIDGDEILAMADTHVISRTPVYDGYRQVEIPSEWLGDYNEIMERARLEMTL